MGCWLIRLFKKYRKQHTVDYLRQWRVNFKISLGTFKNDSKNSFEKLLSRFDSDGKDWPRAIPKGTSVAGVAQW